MKGLDGENLANANVQLWHWIDFFTLFYAFLRSKMQFEEIFQKIPNFFVDIYVVRTYVYEAYYLLESVTKVMRCSHEQTTT